MASTRFDASGRRRFAVPVLAAALALCAIFAQCASAAEIVVISAGAMRSVLEQIAPPFEQTAGDWLRTSYATAGGVEQRVRAGEPFDVALVTKPRLEALAAAGKIAPGSIVVLGRSPIGLAVRKGAPKPDISTVEAVKRALLAATSIAYTDPASGGTSGIHFARELERLGVAEQLRGKLVPVAGEAGAPPAVGKAVAEGRAELAIQPISELNGVPGIDIVGPLPAEMQTPELTYAAGIAAAGGRQGSAEALVRFLAGLAGTAAVKAKGMVPGDGG